VRVTPHDKIKLILNSATRGLLFNEFRYRFNNKNHASKEKYRVYGVSGCCFAFNLTVAKDIKPFDDKVFLYNEEWLLAEKCYRSGLTVILTKQSRVVHVQGATTKSLKLFTYHCFMKSEAYVLKTLFPEYYISNFVIKTLRLPRLLSIHINQKLRKFE
jgi:GT2 family glycosyltransferase